MIIVTGASGFLGRYLVDYLVEVGEHVIAAGRNSQYDDFFTKRGVSRISLDVTDPGTFNRLPQNGVRAVVHLAAVIPAAAEKSGSDIFLRTNALGTLYALNYCRRNNINKFLFTTTRFECSEHSDLPITESMGRNYSLTGDHAAYVIAEVCGSEYVEHYSREYGMQGIIFRLAGLLGYGRYEGVHAGGKFYPSAFETFYRNAKLGRSIEIWGAHQVKRDTLYVKDAVRAIYAAISSESARGVYCIASGEGRTIEDEAKIFAEVFGSDGGPVRLIYRPEIPEKVEKSYYFDISKAERDFGWAPVYAYADILRDYDREVKLGRFKAKLVSQPRSGANERCGC